MAESNARRDPEPTEKCAVAAASPISTTFSWCHRSQSTRGNCIHTAEPRRCAAFDIRACPPRCRSKIRRQVSTVSSGRHRRKAPAVPGLGQALDDEGRSVTVELVDVGPDPAVRRPLEDEGEGVVELLLRAQPHEPAATQVDIRTEDLLRTRA